MYLPTKSNANAFDFMGIKYRQNSENLASALKIPIE